MNRLAWSFRLKHIYGRLGSIASKMFGPRRLVGTSGTASDLAVIIHLFYPEMWPDIYEKLNRIPATYDLYITTPTDKYHHVKDMLQDVSSVTIIPCPNHGRDILPFLTALHQIAPLGYVKVLKLHSKKSTHRIDGNEWSSTMMDNLLPDTSTIKGVLKTLEDPITGIIGPKDEYLQLSVNFEANGMHMSYMLKQIFGKQTTYRMLQSERSQHGFFAGSMFWARFDALRPLIDQGFYSPSYFEKEKGQIDGTFAHAVERVFSLISEAEGRRLYEVGGAGVRAVSYDTNNIPDWSSVYIGPQ